MNDLDLTKATIGELCRALNSFRKESRIQEPDEYGFSSAQPLDGQDQPIPQGFAWIAAFPVVGGSEGYYVHVELIWRGSIFAKTEPLRQLIGLAKTYDMEHAIALAGCASRFLMERCIW